MRPPGSRSGVLVRQTHARALYSEKLGQPDVEGWRMPYARRGNSIRIYARNGDDAYCQFFFLLEGWELRTVRSHGLLKARTIAASDR